MLHTKEDLEFDPLELPTKPFYSNWHRTLLLRRIWGLRFIHQRHTNVVGQDVKYHITSSIWHGTSKIRGSIWKNIRWILGNQLQFIFVWKIGLVISLRKEWVFLQTNDRILSKPFSEFWSDNGWVIGSYFAELNLEIYVDIVVTKVASNATNRLVWTMHKSGEITSKVAYNYCRNKFSEIN